eukprot:scaffold43339_cov32-Tisochrysis_lutea.AAC.4
MPLGFPVEPEVYKMNRGCEDSTGLGGTSSHKTRTNAGSESGSMSEMPHFAAASCSASCALAMRAVPASTSSAVDSLEWGSSASTLISVGEASAAAAVDSTASRNNAELVMKMLAPTSSRRWASDAVEVPAAMATYGIASLLAAWIHTTASSPFGRWMAMRGALTPSTRRCNA